MKKGAQVYLDDIIESIGKIDEYTASFFANQFKKDTAIQDAVIRRLAIIGEAVKNLPPEIKQKYPSVPWKQIAGMRDILIHEYTGVSLERVWVTIREDLEPLKKTITEILKIK